MDKLTSNTNEEDQIMASVARDLGEDLKVNHLWSFKSGNTKLVRLLPKNVYEGGGSDNGLSGS